MKSDSPPSGISKIISKLDEIVNHMESEAITLEESLDEFERGIKLVRSAQSALRDAEQRIEVLAEPDEELDSFTRPDESPE